MKHGTRSLSMRDVIIGLIPGLIGTSSTITSYRLGQAVWDMMVTRHTRYSNLAGGLCFDYNIIEYFILLLRT